MKRFFLALCVLFVFLFSGCNFGDKVIASYGKGKKIYLSTAVSEYNNLDYESKAKFSSTEDCFRFVRKVALERIIFEKAKKENLDNNKTLKERLNKSKKNIGFEVLRKKNILDKVKPGKEDYLKYSKRYSLYHIVKRTDIMNEAKVSESKKILGKLSDEIKDFQMFKSYARKYSDDITAQEGGYIGDIRAGIMEESIDRVIKELPVNKISPITESSNGMHIFYIEKITEVPLTELYNDKEIYEAVYNDKRAEVEEKWYDSLMKETSLKMNTGLLKEKKRDEKIVLSYKSRKVTRKEFYETADQYRQEYFPEPTFDELVKLLKNIALDIIIEEKASESNVLTSGVFKDRVEKEKKFLMISEYINKNLNIPAINENDIADFYNKNKKTLFTFKEQSGRVYIQPLSELKDFITQKLQEKNIQDARYSLYRKIVDEEHLSVDEKVLDAFKKAIGK